MSEARLKIRHGAEQSAGRLPPLQIAAEQVAATVAQGVHGRRRVGIGETFWQFRRYVPGDSTRSIDWRQSAKTDHIYIRETEWAAAQSVWLWRDPSPSMAYRSARSLPEKRDRADLLLLALASLLNRAGEMYLPVPSPSPPVRSDSLVASWLRDRFKEISRENPDLMKSRIEAYLETAPVNAAILSLALDEMGST